MLGLRPLVKWQRHNLRHDHLAAHIDLQGLADVGEGNRNIRHADVLLKKWRRAAGSYLARALSFNPYVLTVTRDAAIGYFKADQFSLDSFFLLLCQRFAADEIRFI